MDRHPPVNADELGWLTEQQMIEVDRVMIEDLRIELIQMMENAGRHLASLIIDRFEPRSVTVLAGSGGADISVPPAVYRPLGVVPAPFDRGPILPCVRSH